VEERPMSVYESVLLVIIGFLLLMLGYIVGTGI